MAESVDVVVVGGGVTGLAAAAAVAADGHSVVVLERHPRPGMECSTHNSAVMHAGLYYPAGSLKATLCVEGLERLYAFCREHDVPHERCGKLVAAATDDEVATLERLMAGARANGVEGLTIVDGSEVRRREPRIQAVAAMWSPNTGRIEAEGAGADAPPGCGVARRDPALRDVARRRRAGARRTWPCAPSGKRSRPAVSSTPAVYLRMTSRGSSVASRSRSTRFAGSTPSCGRRGAPG